MVIGYIIIIKCTIPENYDEYMDSLKRRLIAFVKNSEYLPLLY